ncbi:unnamed protein product [Notodromas monacha]|uniref:Dynactin subunit 5 n=1 Tax=Notodromas monacha TaxID=399045 RepID=A0A7R9BNC7_9CRUS|nr:unnamed protein product [Notodromas monacha]CAG0917310.1 unnamed protein product [Notodromas monacha]
MELPDIYYYKPIYVETASGNKVCKQSVLSGAQNIILNGKNIVMEDCVVRGDLAGIRTGRHCVISQKTILHPPFKKFAKNGAYFPLHIGDHVFIGADSVICAGTIGTCVHIGRDCVIGEKSVLKDCCIIEDGTVIPPQSVVPAFAIYSGNPGRQIGEAPESMEDLMMEYTRSFYRHFKPVLDLEKATSAASAPNSARIWSTQQ